MHHILITSTLLVPIPTNQYHRIPIFLGSSMHTMHIFHGWHTNHTCCPMTHMSMRHIWNKMWIFTDHTCRMWSQRHTKMLPLINTHSCILIEQHIGPLLHIIVYWRHSIWCHGIYIFFSYHTTIHEYISMTSLYMRMTCRDVLWFDTKSSILYILSLWL